MKNKDEKSWLTGYVASINPTEVALMKGAPGVEWDCVRTATPTASSRPRGSGEQEDVKDVTVGDAAMGVHDNQWYDEALKRWVYFDEEYEEVRYCETPVPGKFPVPISSPRVVGPTETPPRSKTPPPPQAPATPSGRTTRGIPAGVEVHGIGTDSHANTLLSFNAPSGFAGADASRARTYRGTEREPPRAPGHGRAPIRPPPGDGESPRKMDAEGRRMMQVDSKVR